MIPGGTKQSAHEEHAAFVPIGGRQIYSFSYTPKACLRARCLFLNSFDNEANNSVRLYVRACRELVNANISAVRFDYYGTGNSKGEASDLTLSTLLDDIAAVAENARTESMPLWLVAGRFGAALGLLAVKAGLALDGLIVWDPVVNVSREFGTRFVNKTLLNNKLMDGGATTRPAMDRVADATGTVELSCIAFSRQFYCELSNLTVSASAGSAIPLALVLFTGKQAPETEIDILSSYVHPGGLTIRAFNFGNSARNWGAEDLSESWPGAFLLENTIQFIAGCGPAQAKLWKN